MKLVSSKGREKSTILLVVIILFAMSAGFALKFNKNQYLRIEDRGINSSQGLIFDGLVSNYTFSIFGGTYNTEFMWTQKSSNWFNVTWNVPGSDLSTWLENRDTRIMLNTSGPWAFSALDHTPMWIFTNVSISDVVLLCIDADGDYPYLVAKEFIYHLPGLGAIEVWQLEDIINPGGFALYEKSTGFLVRGLFPFAGDNYTLDITYTNAIFNYVTPFSGLIDGLYIRHNATFSMIGPVALESNFTFNEYLPNVFNVTWNLDVETGTWTDNALTRIMSYVDTFSPNFGVGFHDPSWIPLNVSLNDYVPISVDGIGDRIFEVIDLLRQNLPGYGVVEVWWLQDTIDPNSNAFYEKSTGILLDGIFFYPAGNYTFQFIATNAPFQYYTPPDQGIPGFNLIVLIAVFSVLSVAIIIQRKKIIN